MMSSVITASESLRNQTQILNHEFTAEGPLGWDPAGYSGWEDRSYRVDLGGHAALSEGQEAGPTRSSREANVKKARDQSQRAKRLNCLVNKDLRAICGVLATENEPNSPPACWHLFGFPDLSSPGRINVLMIAGCSASSPLTSPDRRQIVMEPLDPAERPVLVLDFGSQYVQLIARRVREQHAFARIVRHDITAERVRGAEPAGADPLRRAGQRLRAGRAAVRPGALRPGHPGPGHLLRDAARLRGARRQGRGRARRASSAGPSAACSTPDEPLFHGVPDDDDRLDEPRRPGAGRRRRLRPAGRDRHLPDRRRQAPRRGRSTASSSTPRSRTRPYGAADPGQLPRPGLRQPGHVEDGGVHRASRRARSRARSGRATGSSAASPAASIRRSCAALLAQAIGPQVVCIFVDNGLLRAGERAAVAEAFGDHFERRPARRRRRASGSSRRSRGVTDPQEKRRPDRPHVHRRLQRRGEVDPRRPVPGPGDALPRRDRERRRPPTARPRRSSTTTTSAACRTSWASS